MNFSLNIVSPKLKFIGHKILETLGHFSKQSMRPD